MNADLLKGLGQVAGIGGISLGVFFLLYRDIIRKKIFPRLPPNEAYRLLRLITIAVWSVAVLGILAWFFGSRMPSKPATNTTNINKESSSIQSGEESVNIISNDSTVNVSN